jgi:hypothetical protein
MTPKYPKAKHKWQEQAILNGLNSKDSKLHGIINGRERPCLILGNQTIARYELAHRGRKSKGRC